MIAGAPSAQQVRAHVSAAVWSLGAAEPAGIDTLLSREGWKRDGLTRLHLLPGRTGINGRCSTGQV